MIPRKERIVFTAIDVMNELGVQALSTKKIAEYEKISESTVFKHFENKNMLLLAVLNFYAKFDLDIIESIKIKALKGVDGVNYFTDAFTNYYQNYPAITAITQGLDEMRYIEPLAARVEEIITIRSNCMLSLLEEAQENNEIDPDVSAELLVDIVTGTINGIVRRWRLTDYEFPLKERCSIALSYILKPIKVR
jgi:AcrR family transcriptional regulator